ncbi:MAG: cytochrome c-type biogenesis protein [Steroidobacteraceae bacterium]
MRVLVLALSVLLGLLAHAVDSSPPFEDPAEQERYERLIRDLRCLVCQNESIADSNAMLAGDLRREVRELMIAGRSDDEIRTFMTERYGDFVLYRPPLKPRTWLLWSAPVLLLLGGVGIVVMVVARRARTARADPATLEEEPDRQ